MDHGTDRLSLADKERIYRGLKTYSADDELDEEEIRERQRSRSFFKPSAAGKKVDLKMNKKSNAHPHHATAHMEDPQQESLPQGKAREEISQNERPKRVSSAPDLGNPNTSAVDNPLSGALSSANKATFMRTASVPRLENTAAPDTLRSPSAPLGFKRIRSDATDNPRQAFGTKRRKRSSDFAERRERDQIFKDLSFFYIPNDDVAPARRIRINKAKEYGAAWTRVISGATHVVVDKALRWQDVEKILSGADKARPPKVVNEEYPIDCVMFKSILDTGQNKYRLAGQPISQPEVAAPEPPPSSEESVRSLRLKPPQRNPKKWDYVPPEGTPTRSEESSQRSRVARTPVDSGSQAVAREADRVASSLAEEAPESRSRRSNEGLPGVEGATKEIVTDTKGDELSEYINMMQEYKDLPLDAEDEDDARSTIDLTEVPSDSEHSGSNEEHERKKGSTKTRSKKNLRFEERFACHTATTKDDANKDDNPNARTIEVLQQMATYYDRIDDHWRTLGYRKAIATLKRQTTKITTEDDAFRLPAIGSRLAQKIEEIVSTDKLKRLEYAEAEPMNVSLQLFMQIYGVGNRQAQQWLAQGYRTLEDLTTKAKLSDNQRVWIDHHDDLVTRIPRREVQALGGVVKQAARRIDPKTELIIGGSFRRGAKDSGDIDFIITKANTESTADLVPFLNDLVSRLEASNFLVARLASSRSGTDGSKWHGCCILPPTPGINLSSAQEYKPVWRRVDFLLVPETEIGAALIYFTGNDIFNRSMRLLASRKGMRLNQRGLYKDVLRGAGRAKVTDGELLEGRDERRIFEVLGVRWREPHERWC